MPLCPTVDLSNGKQMPIVGFGTSREATKIPGVVREAVKDALRCGYRHIDTAAMYDNEDEVGQAIHTCIKEGFIKREDIFLTTKIGNQNLDPESVRLSCLLSLKNLEVTYLDLLLIHKPMALHNSTTLSKPGSVTETRYMSLDVEKTWRAMEELLKEGLVRSIGVSNFSIKQVQRVLDCCFVKPVCNQVEVSVYCPNEKLVQFCQRNGIVIVAYSPFAAPNRRAAQKGERKLLEDPVVMNISAKVKKQPSQVVLRLLLQRHLVVIPKSYTSSRIQENFALFDFDLSEEHMNELTNIDYRMRAFPFLEYKEHPEYPICDDECT